MIIEKLLEGTNLTETEKQIAKYLLDESNPIDHITSNELASKSYTSQSSVVRLYKKLGISSYREFIMKLSLERKEYYQSQDLFENDITENFKSYDLIMMTLTKMYNKTITNTKLKLDRNTITRICNRIISIHTIDIYASGYGEAIGLRLQTALQSLGKYCTFNNHINQLYLNNISDSKNHMAILITLDNDQGIIHIAKALKEYHIYSVVFLDSLESELVYICQDVIIYDKTEISIPLELETITAMISIEYIVLLLLSLVYAKTQNILSKY
ncbi:MAG: hypothetical protein LUH02_03295 [Erysipelotrichaceae bacterium]|nr:hypothetical protein [Erysipelotrichaceae bacterium]